MSSTLRKYKVPLTPSPEEFQTLVQTLSNIWIGRWSEEADEDDPNFETQRALIVIPYDNSDTQTGPFENGEPDYSHAAQFVALEELDELINALLLHRNWLANQGVPKRDWAVHVTTYGGHDKTVELLGPYTKKEADAKFDTLMAMGGGDPDEIQVLQLIGD